MKATRDRVALYARVSTLEQHLDEQVRGLRQEAKLRGWKVAAEYAEKRSTRAFRPELEAMLNRALRHEHDAILVWRLDRLGRSLIELVQNVDRLVERGVVVVSVKDGALDTSSAGGRLQLAVLGAAAEFEREVLRERTREGLARARAAGKQLGRPRVDSPALQGALAWCEYMAPSVSRRTGLAPSVRRTAREYGVPETTLRRALETRAKNGVSKAVRAALGRRRSFLRAP